MDGKYTFWGMIIAALITVLGSYYIFYESKEVKKVEEKNKVEKIKQEIKESKANLIISKTYLPSVNTELDSIFFTQITNNSVNNAKDISIKINLKI